MTAAGARLRRAARPLFSVGIGLLLAGIVMQASGYDVRAAYAALWTGATGLRAGPAVSSHAIPLPAGPWALSLDTFTLAQTLARVTPLLFTGLAVALGLRAGLFNIGAQGQMVFGALLAAIIGSQPFSATAPPLLLIPLVLLAGAFGGALWGALAGFLKAARGVHEVLATIMLNYIAANIADYLATHGLKDPYSMAAQTPPIARAADLPVLVPGSNLTAGLLLAMAAALGMVFLMRRLALGYAIRAVGLGAEAARANGIPVARTVVLTLALSGALAGMAGAVEVMGVHHRYVQGIAGTYGFDGIAVALLGGLDGFGVILSALFFGALANGAAFMQLKTDVPESIAVLVQAVVILFAGVRYVRKTRVNAPQAATEAEERLPDYASL